MIPHDRLLAFATAAVACIVLKILIALATFGFGVLPDFFDALGKRMSIGDTSSMSNGGLMVFGSKIIGGLSGLAGNMRLLAGLTIALAVVAGIWGFTTIRMCSLSDRLREQSLFLLASNVVIPVWLVAFWQHTIQHAWLWIGYWSGPSPPVSHCSRLECIRDHMAGRLRHACGTPSRIHRQVSSETAA